MADHGLDVDTATHLCGVYGARADRLAARIAEDAALGERIDPELPYVWAEIEFAADHDLARTVEDVLARRVPLLLVARDQGLGVCDRVARCARRPARLVGRPARPDAGRVPGRGRAEPALAVTPPRRGQSLSESRTLAAAGARLVCRFTRTLHDRESLRR